MEILFTRSTKPHQLDINLLSENDAASASQALSQHIQADTFVHVLPYHPPLHVGHKAGNRKKYQPLLIDTSI